jgi:hypothetical protein
MERLIKYLRNYGGDTKLVDLFYDLVGYAIDDRNIQDNFEDVFMWYKHDSGVNLLQKEEYDTTDYYPAFFLLMYIQETIDKSIVDSELTFKEYMYDIDAFFEEMPAIHSNELYLSTFYGIYIHRDKLPFVIYRMLQSKAMPFEVYTLLCLGNNINNALSSFEIIGADIHTKVVSMLPIKTITISNNIEIPIPKSIVEMRNRNANLSTILKKYIIGYGHTVGHDDDVLIDKQIAELERLYDRVERLNQIQYDEYSRNYA